MKNSFRKLIPDAAALGFAFAASSAQAFTLKDGTNVLATDSTTLDWNASGSGVAKGVGPFGNFLTPNQKFQFLYQANLASVDGDTTGLFGGLDFNANGTKGPGKSFEFTIVAKLNEKVTEINGASATFGLDGKQSDNKVAIYYDTKANASTSGGTGFDDGQLIALLTIVPENTQSTFKVTGANSGQGSTKMSARIVESGDFIDPNYIQGISELFFGVNFESNLNFPAGNSYTTNFHKGGSSLFPDYTVNTAKDIVFKVDGSNTFAVPEPGTMMLLGMGMLGLVGAQRRRRAPKA